MKDDETMEKFSLKCKFCGNTDQTKFQTTLEPADGYSAWTILEDGYIEFKCKSCGTFGSTDEEKTEGNNKRDMFEVTCNNCGSNKWSYDDGSCDDDPEISCDGCDTSESRKFI